MERVSNLPLEGDVMKKSVILGGITTLALAMSLSAGAATPSSSTSVGKVEPKLIDKITASYLNVLYGPAIMSPREGMGRFRAGYLPDTDSGANNTDSRVFTKNYLSLGYKLSDTLTVGPVAYWAWYPVGAQDYQIRDPYIKLGNSKFLSRGNLKMTADLRLAAPVAQNSRNNGMITYLMSKQITSYSIPSTRLTAGLTTYALARFHGTGTKGVANEKRNDIEAYAGPSLDYQVASNLTAGVLYEVSAAHTVGQGFNFNNDGTNLEPNLNWDVTPNVNFNPWLDIAVGKRIAGDTTTFGAALTLKIL
jgi:hypothetical protein